MTIVFASMPDPPVAHVTVSELNFFAAVKHNLDMLTGAKGDAPTPVFRGTIKARLVTPVNLTAVSAQGSGLRIPNGPNAFLEVPTLEDYRKLVQDVARLKADVDAVRESYNSLLTQMKV
jgi:hypothetical protein